MVRGAVALGARRPAGGDGELGPRRRVARRRPRAGRRPPGGPGGLRRRVVRVGVAFARRVCTARVPVARAGRGTGPRHTPARPAAGAAGAHAACRPRPGSGRGVAGPQRRLPGWNGELLRAPPGDVFPPRRRRAVAAVTPVPQAGPGHVQAARPGWRRRRHLPRRAHTGSSRGRRPGDRGAGPVIPGRERAGTAGPPRPTGTPHDPRARGGCARAGRRATQGRAPRAPDARRTRTRRSAPGPPAPAGA